MNKTKHWICRWYLVSAIAELVCCRLSDASDSSSILPIHFFFFNKYILSNVFFYLFFIFVDNRNAKYFFSNLWLTQIEKQVKKNGTHKIFVKKKSIGGMIELESNASDSRQQTNSAIELLTCHLKIQCFGLFMLVAVRSGCNVFMVHMQILM